MNNLFNYVFKKKKKLKKSNFDFLTISKKKTVTQRKSFFGLVKEKFTEKNPYDPFTDFILSHFKYDNMNSDLKVMDEEFVGKLRYSPNDSKLIRDYITKIAYNSEHAIYTTLDAFYERFKEKFFLEDAHWVNLKDCLIEINHFNETLVNIFIGRWKNSYLNTEFAKSVIEETLKTIIATDIFEHIIQIYRLQADNREREKQIEKLFEITLEDLNIPKELLLENEEDPYSNAIYALNQILSYKDPTSMMTVIEDTYKKVQEYIKDYKNVQEEHLLSVYLYIIIRANIPELSSYLHFISDFGDVSKFTSDEQSGYSMLDSALKWSLNIEPPQKWGNTTEVHTETFDGFGDENQEEVKESETENQEIQEDNTIDRQEEFDSQGFDQKLYEKNEEIKEMEKEIDELYKELQKHMNNEKKLENENQKLKEKLSQYEKSIPSQPSGKNFMQELQGKLKKETQMQIEKKEAPKPIIQKVDPPQEAPNVEPVKNEPVKEVQIKKDEVNVEPVKNEPVKEVPTKKIESPKYKQPEVIDPFSNPQLVPVISSQPNVKLVPLTITVNETLSITYQGKNLESFKLIGQIGVQGYSKDHQSEISSKSEHSFKMNINNTGYLTGILNNPKYSKKTIGKNNSILLDCKVPSSDLIVHNNLENVIILKYNLVDDYQPLPIKIQPVYKLNKSSLDVMIQFLINPQYFKEYAMDQLCIRVLPIIKNAQGQIIPIKKSISKPEGILDQEKQIYEWKYQNIKASSTNQPEKIIGQFFTSLESLEGCTGTISINATFSCSGKTMGELLIEGCDSKKSSENELFVGGVKHKILHASISLMN